jgi:hypothetical protein
MSTQKLDMVSDYTVSQWPLPLDISTASDKVITDACTPALWLRPDAAVITPDANGKVAAWLDSYSNNGLQFVPAGSAPPAIVNEAVATFTGGIGVTGKQAILTVTAVASGTISQNATILTGAVANTIIRSQLPLKSGEATGGIGRYIVDTQQTIIAGTAMTASAFSSVSFSGAAGQALFDPTLSNIIPASGGPCTIAVLYYETSGAGTFGGGIAGNPLNVSTNHPLIIYTPTSGTASFQFQSQGGVSGQSIYGAVNTATGAGHYSIVSFPGASAGGQVWTDGATDGTGTTNTITLASDSKAQQLVLGGYYSSGYPGTLANPGKFKLGMMIVLPIDLTLTANAAILAALNAILANAKTQLGW